MKIPSEKGLASIILSQVPSNFRCFVFQATGMIGAPPKRAAAMAPAVILILGPLGPSGVIPMDRPFCNSFKSFLKPIAPPLFEEPATVLYPKNEIARPISSPSLCADLRSVMRLDTSQPAGIDKIRLCQKSKIIGLPELNMYCVVGGIIIFHFTENARKRMRHAIIQLATFCHVSFFRIYFHISWP